MWNMYITCKCLNVSIKSRSSELQKINIDDTELTADERADSFFCEDIATISELEGITKEQPSLVEARKVGSWIIHRCYNCSMYTHAVHREHGAALVFINTNMIMSLEEVVKLKLSYDYSTVFRIIINHHNLEDLDYLQQPTKSSVLQLTNTLQVALSGLQQQLEAAVQRETVDIEEKIRTYTTEQYQLLEQFREQAHNEHRLLTRLIYSNRNDTNKLTRHMESTAPNVDDFKTNQTNAVTTTVNISQTILPDSSENTLNCDSTRRQSPNAQIDGKVENQNTSCTFPKEQGSFDAEALFPLEGIEDALTTDETQSSGGESDTDSGQDEGIHMPRGQRGAHPTLAKSLPVSVPIFSSFVRRTTHDQDDDQLARDPFDPHNIRASIKALAKSVHGDTVFGDLPRPRFSTLI